MFYGATRFTPEYNLVFSYSFLDLIVAFITLAGTRRQPHLVRFELDRWFGMGSQPADYFRSQPHPRQNYRSGRGRD